MFEAKWSEVVKVGALLSSLNLLTEEVFNLDFQNLVPDWHLRKPRFYPDDPDNVFFLDLPLFAGER